MDNSGLMQIIMAAQKSKAQQQQIESQERMRKAQMLPALLQSYQQMAMNARRQGLTSQSRNYQQKMRQLVNEFDRKGLQAQNEQEKASMQTADFLNANTPHNRNEFGVGSILGLQNMASYGLPAGIAASAAGFGYGGLPKNKLLRKNRLGRRVRNRRSRQIANFEAPELGRRPRSTVPNRNLRNLKRFDTPEFKGNPFKAPEQGKTFEKVGKIGRKGAKGGGNLKKLSRAGGWAGLALAGASLANSLYNAFGDDAPQKVVDRAEKVYDGLRERTDDLKYFREDMLNEYDDETGMTYRDLLKAYEGIARENDLPGKNLVSGLIRTGRRNVDVYGEAPGQRQRNLDMDYLQRVQEMQNDLIQPGYNNPAQQKMNALIEKQIGGL